MTGKFETRLAELGVTLADAPAPAANYVPFVQVGDLVEALGDAGQHARAAVSAPSLPLGVAVEIEGIFQIA